jgi:ABC-type transport system involved in multi-copper enzyme maturation permease subunit
MSLKRRLSVWGALAEASVLESIRRKDLWVAVILAVLMIGGAKVIGQFGTHGIEIFIKDVTLTVINAFSIILAILFAARQLPEEISRRTVYPLLARPISRTDLLIGKYLGALALSTLGLALFGLVGWAALASYSISVGPIFVQFLILRFFSLALICALTLTLSIFLTAAATVTLSILLALGSATFSQAVLLSDSGATGFGKSFMRLCYFMIPQLNLFDLSKKVSYGWPALASWVILALLAYALIHSVICLTVGALRFRKQAL